MAPRTNPGKAPDLLAKTNPVIICQERGVHHQRHTKGGRVDRKRSFGGLRECTHRVRRELLTLIAASAVSLRISVDDAKLLAPTQREKALRRVSADDLPADCRRGVVESTGRDDCVVICLTTRWKSRISGRLLGIETITGSNLRDRLRCDAMLIGLQTPQ
jgi:hypothetical protein